jgi:hypothetical protein
MQISNALQKNACGANDTACMIEDRLEWPLQPLKG